MVSDRVAHLARKPGCCAARRMRSAFDYKVLLRIRMCSKSHACAVRLKNNTVSCYAVFFYLKPRSDGAAHQQPRLRKLEGAELNLVSGVLEEIGEKRTVSASISMRSAISGMPAFAADRTSLAMYPNSCRTHHDLPRPKSAQAPRRAERCSEEKERQTKERNHNHNPITAFAEVRIDCAAKGRERCHKAGPSCS